MVEAFSCETLGLGHTLENPSNYEGNPSEPREAIVDAFVSHLPLINEPVTRDKYHLAMSKLISKKTHILQTVSQHCLNEPSS